ncbi:spore coat protein GerQ [Bacillus methanolicus PB1]|uniref:Spore coat protein GerQ n=1 Tax=Bacillus methanolicus PB1 TaxID=997296 RepID=I3E176_BACMT|nr:spore coat protein GerQ [Bacillus methanolicus]EIJ80247.1 spore coat protein GerQ [Bacillus methanolicus PB1]
MNQTNPYASYSTYPYGYGFYNYGVQGQRQQPGFGSQQQGYPYPQAGGPMYSVPMPQSTPTTGPQVPGMLPIEESYIENILRLNKGKLATVYMTFEDKESKVFKGIIEAAGRDHLIISDPQTGTRYLLPMVYLNYVSFDEEIEYEYPLGGGPGLASYPPR